VTLSPQVEGSLLTELWVSLASLIRSYVAAHDIGRPEGSTPVKVGDDGSLTIRGEQKALVIGLDTASGAGHWELHEEGPGPERQLNAGTFELTTASMVEFSDRRGKLELEVAAEAFTAKIFDED
jgi:hypothetical protein